MLNRLHIIRRQFSQLRRYSRLFRARDAIALIRSRSNADGTLTIFSLGLNRMLTIRPSTSDLRVVLKVLADHEYTTPLPINPKLIIDAGANIGISALYFANRYPNARIYAIEPEET